MKKLYYLLGAFLTGLTINTTAQTATTNGNAFQPAEKISYNVYYNIAGIYVNAGSATFTTSDEKYMDQNVFHVVGEGSTNPKYDWIFKVRDRYESYFNANDLHPVKFIRNVNEGKYKKHEEVTFNKQANTAVTNTGVYKVPENVQDVLSTMYFARNINYDQYKSGDKIPFSMFLDDQVYNIYIHYMGKETIKTKYGKFKAIKLKPLLLKGNIFEGGEKMTIWVTDDANHIPVRMESPILVGSVKIDLMHHENLKYELAMLHLE
jgi:hypothetical protein